MNRVAVIGAGTMGNGIAHVFAQHGWGVTLIDVKQEALDRGLATIRSNLDRQVLFRVGECVRYAVDTLLKGDRMLDRRLDDLSCCAEHL